MISSQLLFFFSALGAANGILLAAYLFSRPTQRLANGLLGGLLLAIGIRTGKSTLYHFNPDIAVGFLQVGLSACLLIGPLTYLYVRYCLRDLAQQPGDGRWRMHLACAFLVIGIGVLFPFAQHQQAWYYVICAIHIVWCGYLIAGGWLLWQARALIGGKHRGIPRRSVLVSSVYVGSCVIFIAYVTTAFTSYIVGALSFTFMIHIAAMTYFLKDGEKTETREKYQGRKISSDDTAALLASLDHVMEEQQLYLNPNLSLTLLAKKTGHLQTTVSQVINDHLNKSFNLYINEFRIRHAKRLLLGESHLNMDIVAERSGFNSNSTFFAAFKKITGQTPASYRNMPTAGMTTACSAGREAL